MPCYNITMLNGSLLIARLRGTEIRLHWSMVLIIPYVMITFQPTSFLGGARAFLLVGLVFLFVLFHELGHTLVARAFGIGVPSVVLWPMGGAAMTEREADKPLHDLLIAAAGPFVNLILGGGLLLLMLLIRMEASAGAHALLPDALPGRSLAFLATTNLILGISNLLPMYPLDGGRIFRALVNMLFGPERSNQVTFWLSLVVGVAILAGALALRNSVLAFTALLLLAGAVTLNQPLIAGLMRLYARIARRADIYVRLADFDPAVALLNSSLEAQPYNPVLYLQRGYIHYTLDELLRAMGDADRAVAAAPGYLPAILLKGAVNYALGNQSGAWACIERAEKIQPGWSMNWLNRAVLHRDEGNLATALDDLRWAEEQMVRERDRSSFVLLRLLRSSIFFRQGRREEVQAEWEELYRVSPREALLFTADRQHIFHQDWEWAKAYFAFFEHKLHGSPLIPLMRGEMALRIGQPGQAAADFTIALAQQPANQDICYYRGQAYEQLGEIALAAADYQRAIRVTHRAHIRRMAENRLRLLPAGRSG
jgi:Zn-dependent protease